MGLFKKSQSKKEEKKAEAVKNKPAAVNIKAVNQRELLAIKHPWITEKAGRLIDPGKYIFLVNKDANKPQIAKVVELIYNVKVSSVNIINKKSKIKALGRTKGKVPGHKKAMVQLEKGYKIDVMPTA